MDYLPGTQMQVDGYKIKFGFSNIAPLMSVTKGITLSQVSELTGIEPSTVQNWIKRDWVAHPEGKRYGEYQLARIIIINMLRASMQLDSIAFLLRFINGNADDRNDDIIPDSELYTHLCRIIDEVKLNNVTDVTKTEEIVKNALSDYSEAYDGARQKLTRALTVMTLAYISSEIKKQSELLLGELRENS